jgi:hypothetical protein
VLGVSKTHCKVRFESSTTTGWCTSEEGDGKIEILPLQRIRVWSQRWEGNFRPASQNPNLKDGLHTHVDRGIVEQKDLGSIPGGSGYVLSSQPPTLPALLVCRAAQQALVPKPTQKRVLPSTSHRMFGSDSDEECSLQRSSYRSTAAKQDASDEKLDEGQDLLSRFRVCAKARFGGSLGAAWHSVLDVRGTGRIGYLDFVRGGRALGFTGNYRKLWDVLTENSAPDAGGLLGFEALDPQGAKLLDDFRAVIYELGVTTLDELWEKYLDQDGSGRCLREEFLSTMTGLGWTRSTARQLFRMIDTGGEQDISLDELAVLGLPRRQIARSLTGQELLRLQAEQAREKAFSDFHTYLIKTFGNVVRAWRVGLKANQMEGCLSVISAMLLRTSASTAPCKHSGRRWIKRRWAT